ncbi:hypothetical protein GH714_018012 [Hevea brasiliensis]|uniref:RNase III domain-containing protein n=1 Tax=Hevea brasiliensis TaxID=3981 RepID=A0A6A6KW39_HEVBR|nr:hypothetical protein GH714_018012 [Hevea brasiliensis]
MAYHQELEPEVGAFRLNSESNQMESLPSLNGVEEILSYKFENWRLLEEAFTDSSFPDKRISYEQLEHVGDFVLNLLFTKKHYFKYLDLPPKLEPEPKVGVHHLNLESNQVESLPSLDGVEEILGYKFKNRRLLEEAFTDSSFPDKRVFYERLEHVGDSMLNLLFTKEHNFKYPDLPPGALTRLCAANVNTEKLARVAIKHGLHRFLRTRKPFLRNK